VKKTGDRPARACLELIPADVPLDRAACGRALEEALAAPALDERTACSRLLWLLDPRDPEGLRLVTELPGLAPKELARIIVHPREAVLGIIERRTGLPRPLLDRIYEYLCSPGDAAVHDRLADLPEERILQEMKWWLVDLRFPEYYLVNTPPDVIAAQILANRSWEMLGATAGTNERMKVSMVSREGTRMHWVHRKRCLEVEEEIEHAFAADGRLRDVSVYSPYKDLLLYIVEQTPPGEGDEFSRAAPRGFLAATEPQARKRYEEVRATVLAQGGIVVARSYKEETGEHRVMIGFPRGTIIHFLANVSRSMARSGIELTRKYAVTFGGERPVMVTSLYARQEFPADLATHLVEVGLYPSKGLSDLVEAGALTPAECTFAHVVTLFVHQFISVRDPDLALLAERFGREGDLASIIETLQTRIDRDSFPMAIIEGVLRDRPEIVRDLFTVFRQKFDPSTGRGGGSRARSHLEAAAGAGSTGDEAHVVRWALKFVDAVERTNVFLPARLASAFRLSSRFLADAGFTTLPFGVFFVVGRDFHAFHVRFADVARGGIRIVRSATGDDHARNSDSLFEECYNLALTQHRKNKDIPEGGAKGVVLPGPGASAAEAEDAFKRYVDALLDLLTPPDPAAVVGWAEEILFLGPDEGSADLMGWAAKHARDRGYRYWKAFTTGKEAALGGISHKEHAMTTQGVHRYVLGILRELGVREEDITKVQTGGPDGDLGSNEILISKDRTLAVVDGGGVLWDPDGLDRTELARLSRAGLDSGSFDEARLGPKGCAVRVGDRDRRLPDGTVVASGTGFRNAFHLDPRFRADLFVPCGGRPKSINLANWRSLLDADGQPAFRWIVEGANLFITQEARLKLEEKGVVVFKDSSTNKGGVISSSLEVLAALAIDDERYTRLMCVAPGSGEPEFRRRYIGEAVRHIVDRADREFELLWRSHRATGRPLSVLAEEVSARINQITDEVATSQLVDDPAMRHAALRLQAPALLVEEVGAEAMIAHLPPAYQRALVATAVASTFVYRFGLSAGFEEYRRYVAELARLPASGPLSGTTPS
jgi:glutamate dehydrogenase